MARIADAASRSDASRPWMTALEMKFAALRGVAVGIQHLPASSVGELRDVESMLRRADTYSWTVETSRALLQASGSVPVNTPLSAAKLPSAAGFWWFGTDGGYIIETAIPDERLDVLRSATTGAAVVVAIAWGPSRLSAGAIDVSAFWMGRTYPVVACTWTWPMAYASPRRDRSDGKQAAGEEHLRWSVARHILAGSAWLGQRIAVIDSGHIERHRRRQLSRESGASVESDVKVVQLRRLESRTNVGDSESVEWSCRWIVNGHWRNQPYANGETKLIYILPYVKGPADMPLKIPSHTVYSVSR